MSPLTHATEWVAFTGGTLRRKGRTNKVLAFPEFSEAEVVAKTAEPIGRRRNGRNLWTATDTVTDFQTRVSDGDAVVVTYRWGNATGVSVGTTYYVVSKSTHAFKLATTPGGAAVTIGTGFIDVITGAMVRTVGVRLPNALALYLPTSGSTVTQYGHTLSAGDAVTVVERKTTTAVTIGTTYYVRDVTANTFALAATLGGAAITLGTGSIGYTALTYHAGDYTISAPGEVLEGLYIDGRIVTTNGNTAWTARDCVARGPATATSANGIVVGATNDNGQGGTIEWCELVGRRGIPVAANPTSGEEQAAYVTGLWVDALRVGFNLTMHHSESTGTVDTLALLSASLPGLNFYCNDISHPHYGAWLDSDALPTVASMTAWGPVPGQADRTTHNDIIQAHQGSHRVVANNLGNQPARIMISGTPTIVTATIAVGAPTASPPKYGNRDPRPGKASETAGVSQQRDVIDARAEQGGANAIAMLSATSAGALTLEFTDNILYGGGYSVVNMTNALDSKTKVKRNRLRGTLTGFGLYRQTGSTVDCPTSGADANVNDTTGAALTITAY